MTKEDKIKPYPNSIDTRVALLEMSISNINDSLERMEKRFDRLDDKLDYQFDKLDRKIDSRFFWLLSLQIASFVGLLGVIAKAVHWI